MKDYFKNLNDSQRQAVECTAGPVMIIAGAGSGKTRVLTCRIAHLISQGVDPFRILALTFTNKASREMKERIVSMIGPEANNLWMGTFHSVFAKILRLEAEKLGYPSNFTIYDTDDSKGLIKDILKERSLDEKLYKPDLVYNRISAAKNNLISVKEYRDDSQIQSDDAQGGRPLLGELYEAYSKRCFKASAMDFDDLLFKMFQLLKNFPDVLYKYQHRFSHLLVDEFQDTNYAQYMVLKKLAAVHENICVVGDDAQSIYAFRGANIKNILHFEKDYPDTKTFKLEQNYRSTKNIVGAANSVIANNRAQLKKQVWTDNSTGDKIKVYKAYSDNEEGMLIANAIFEDQMNRQFLYSDFAILYRTNAQSRSFEEALRKRNIPYRIFGGLSFYKRKEIKDLLAYFRLTINPDDEEALKRIINYPVRGIGKTTLEKITIIANDQGISLWEVASGIDSFPADFNAGVRTKITDFVIMIRSFSVMLHTHNAFDLASHIASSTGILKDLYDDKTPEGLSRYENIQELLNGIKEFSEREIPGTTPELPDTPVILPVSLGVFMQDIALLTDADDDDEDKDKVSLMTIHASKGLEFNEVFVVGLEENLFPSQLSMNSREDLEEERRLFYVAITRAKEKLTLSFATSRYRWGNLIQCEPSRFLEEMDREYLDLSATNHGGQKESPQDDFYINQDFETPAGFRNRITRNKKNSPVNKMTGKPFTPLTAVKPAVAIPSEFIPDDAGKIQAGMQVEHQRFGSGKVLTIEGRFPDTKATIFFQGVGQKQLLLKFAKLKIVG